MLKYASCLTFVSVVSSAILAEKSAKEIVRVSSTRRACFVVKGILMQSLHDRVI